jgi:hypothetical protein
MSDDTDRADDYRAWCAEDDDTDPEPIPLTPHIKLPEFPVDQLPGPIAEMVTAVAEATQTDPAMAGTSALSVLSACTGGHAKVEIRAGWREPLNLYTATVANPAERKSAVQMMMVQPLYAVEKELVAEGVVARVEAESLKQIAVNTAKKAIAAAATATDEQRDEKNKEAIAAAALVESIVVPPVPRILADDITSEATAALLAEQGGRLAIISAEGGVLDIIAGRYSTVPNMDVYLKGHCGDPLRIDRKSHPPMFVPEPVLTLGLMIQPDVLASIAAHHEFRGRGFLARILYSYPVSKVGQRNAAAPPVESGIQRRYREKIIELASTMVGWLSDPAVLTLTPDAHEAVIGIMAKIEPMLAGDGALAPLADWGGKYVGAVVRIAGMLHLAELGPKTGPTRSISVDTVKSAARIGAYFRACAVKAFVEMGADQGTADAVYLLERIKRLGQDEVSERDLQRAAQRFKKKDDLLPAIGRLVDNGYLMPLPTSVSLTAGRPASPLFKVHPYLTEMT